MFNIKHNMKGFTMMEMIVAIALFSVTMIMATELFQKMIEGQRNTLAAQNVQESLRYTQEVISKEIRMAQKSGVVECSGSGKVYKTDNGKLYFKNMDGECVTYELDNGKFKITRDADSGYITPDDITVANLEFVVHDDGTGQPFATIKMDAEYKTNKEINKSKIKIQTTISSRYYE